MHKNRTFVALIILVSLLTIWFGSRAFFNLRHYYSLTNRVELQIKNFEITGNGTDSYRLIVYYDSPLGEGKGTLGPIYRNPWAAEKAKERFENRELEAWFNPKKRTLYLSKNFPLKPLLSALALLAITLYFIFLGVFVANRR